MKRALLLLQVLALVSVVAFAQPSPATIGTPSTTSKDDPGAARHGFVLPADRTQPVRMPKFDKPPLIDGKLDDEIWQQAAVLKDFYQVQNVVSISTQLLRL